MATSIVPIGRINVYQKEGKSIPSGWGVDSNGQITQDPAAVRDGGALLPLGGSELMRGYKGYGLSLMVDIFSGVLAGAAFSSHVGNATQDRVCDVGHFFAAVKIEAFRELTEFKKDMDELLDLMRHSPKASGEERIYIHALEMTSLLLDIQAGDEVILPSFTFVSTVNAFVLRGARPVFADIRPDTLNLDESKLEHLITPRTRVIVPVHYAGVGCEMESILAIAHQHG